MKKISYFGNKILPHRNNRIKIIFKIKTVRSKNLVMI